MLLLYCEFVIMSQVTMTATTLPVTVVYSSAATTTITVGMAPNSAQLASALGLYDVGLSPPLIMKDSERCCWPCHCATAATSVPDAFSGFANYAMDPHQVIFLFHSLASSQFLNVGVCYSVCFLFPGSSCECQFHQCGLSQWSLHHCKSLEYTNVRHVCLLVLVWVPCQELTE